MKASTLPSDSSLSLREGVQHFEDHFGFGDSQSTRRTYLTALKAWLESLSETGIDIDQVPLEDLDPSVAHEYIQWLNKARKSVIDENRKKKTVLRFRQPTVQLYVSTLLRGLRFWREEGFIQFTAAREKGRRQASQIQSKKDKTLSGRASQVDENFGDRMLSAVFEMLLPPKNRLLDHLEVLRARALISLLYSTALRVGDVCRLTKQDLARARVGDGILEIPMKKTGRKAYVFVSSFTLKAVQEYLDAREDRRPFLLISHGRGRRGAADILSRENYGIPLPERAAHRIVKNVAKRAFPRGKTGFVGPHAFRHWHGQRLRLMGVPIDQIQAILGHSSPAVTEQNYAPLPSRKVIEEIELRLQEI